jgi:hypothetical protein
MPAVNKDVKKYCKLACECIGKEMQKLAFDANLYKNGMSDTPHSKRSHEKYIELAAALQYFEDLQKGTGGLPLFNQ